MLMLLKVAAENGICLPPELAMVGKTLLNPDEIGLTLARDHRAADAARLLARHALQHRGGLEELRAAPAGPLMRIETPFRLFGYPGLAILLFLAAAAGAIALAVSILVSDIRAKRRPRGTTR